MGDRRQVAQWVYGAFRDAHRALPASLFGELTGYSYWQARRLLEVFGREVGPIDVSDHSDATAFLNGVRERMPGGVGVAQRDDRAVPAFAAS